MAYSERGNLDNLSGTDGQTTAQLGSGDQDTLILQAGGQDAIEVPGEDYIANAQILRDGQDLILEAPDGSAVVIEDYFSAMPTPDIASPDGSTLTPQLVDSFVTQGANYASNAGLAHDASPVGAIDEISGQATITRADGTVEPLAIGTPIFQGDVIETSASGAVNIVFIDETSFAVSENARLSIDEYTFDPATESGVSNFSVLRGIFVFTSGLIGRDDPDDVTIDTPVGSIGIRGTIIAGKIMPGGDSEITVVEGAIVVRNGLEDKTLSMQFETVKLGGFNDSIQDMGVLSANDVSDKFGAVSDVSPTLFSAIKDAAQDESGSQQSDDGRSEDSGAGAGDGQNTDAQSEETGQNQNGESAVQTATAESNVEAEADATAELDASVDSGDIGETGDDLIMNDGLGGDDSDSLLGLDFGEGETSGDSTQTTGSEETGGETTQTTTGGETGGDTTLSGSNDLPPPPPPPPGGEGGTTEPAGPLFHLIGDINRDGFEDRAIRLDSGADTGKVQVEFGLSGGGFGGGFMLNTSNPATDGLGFSIGDAGDFNADGRQDFIVSANGAGPNDGASYVVYGSDTFSDLNLDTLNPTQGIRLDTQTGSGSVAAGGVGDFTGDGISDVAMYQQNGNNTLRIFAGDETSPGTVIKTIFASNELLQLSAAGIGDYNGDGKDDIAVTSFNGTGHKAYVVFGDNTSVDLSSLSPTDGVLIGTFGSDLKVRDIGDTDGDGFANLKVEDQNGSQVFNGGNLSALSMQIGGTASASTNGDILIGSNSGDTLTENSKTGVVFSGGGGNDTIELDEVNGSGESVFDNIDGGSGFDTVKFTNAGSTIDFSNVGSEQMTGIEKISFGGDNQTIKLSAENIFNLLQSSDNGELIIDDGGHTGLTLEIDDPAVTIPIANAIPSSIGATLGSSTPANPDGEGYFNFDIGGYSLRIDQNLIDGISDITIS